MDKKSKIYKLSVFIIISLFLIFFFFLINISGDSDKQSLDKSFGYNWEEVKNLDGTYTKRIYQEPVFLQNLTNLTSDSDGNLIFKTPSYTIKIKLKIKDKNNQEKEIKDSKKDNKDLVVKENILKLDNSYKFSWNVKDKKNLDIKSFYLELENVSNVRFENNKFYLPDGIIIDLNDLISNNYSLKKETDKKIEILADSSKGKTFNVMELDLDPTINYSSSADTQIRPGAFANTNYGSDTSATLDDGSGYKALIDFDLSSIPTNSQVTDAQIYLYFSTTSDSTKIFTPITKSWTEAGVTWNSRNGVDNWDTAGLGATDYNTTYQISDYLDGN